MTTTPSVTSYLPNGDPFAARPAAKSNTESIANKETFLQLLVAQIRNQDPMNPADGVEFLTQLAQFTNLEQSLAMRSDLDAIRTGIEKIAAGGGS